MNSTPVVPRITALTQWLAIPLVCGLLGCGGAPPADPNRAVVSGTVSLEGQPLRGGSVSFETATEGTTTYIRSDGTYTTDRAPLGKNVVTIETESLKFGNPSAYVAIPSRYNELQTSGLKVEIKPGENTNVNFEMKR